MKPVFVCLLMLITGACLFARALDEQAIQVKSGSLENKIVVLNAELAGKETTLTCFTERPACSAPQPGEYVAVKAETDEGIYEDCTNLVLYGRVSASGARQRIGVYCWLNESDCHAGDCGSGPAQPITSGVSDKAAERGESDVCQQQSRPDCREAVAFFGRLQRALATDDRVAVASMARFPLRVKLNGKSAFIQNRSELLRHYDTVFDPAVRCALEHAKRSEVWNNWQGFTVGDGVVWWEKSVSPASAFKLITVNNGASHRGCGGEPQK